MPFGAIYLHMGTTPNPAYIQLLRDGEKDSGITSTRLSSLGSPLERQQGSPFIQQPTSQEAWACEVQADAGVGRKSLHSRSYRMRSNVTALVSNKVNPIQTHASWGTFGLAPLSLCASASLLEHGRCHLVH